MNLLEVSDVSKNYTGHKALDNVSLSVPEGTIYGLLGPNGAGKTTLIRIINHITAPDSGSVIFNGHPLTAADVANIGYLPEERGLYKKMKVGEQAVFFARLKGLSKAEATRSLREWFERFDILSWWNRKVEELSKGMAQKVQFIVTVLHRPKLLIFDEPFSGFDPINANLLKEEIIRLKNEGSTVIFSTHNMASVEELCENITLIIRREYSDGRYDILFSGDSRELMAALQPLAGNFEISEAARDRSSLRLLLNQGTSLRDIIEIANNTVEISAINEVMASMNDIFISTVGTADLEIQ